MYVIFFQNPELKSQTSLLKNNFLLKASSFMQGFFYDLKTEYVMKEFDMWLSELLFGYNVMYATRG